MNRWALFAPALLVVAACGGSTLETSDGGADGSADAAKDAPVGDTGPDTSGPYACGKVLCQTGELCVHPCCGGAPPPCEPKEDGGTCPPGYIADPNCGIQGGCRPPPCTPPEPFCSQTSTCGPPPPNGRDVSCLCG